MSLLFHYTAATCLKMLVRKNKFNNEEYFINKFLILLSALLIGQLH